MPITKKKRLDMENLIYSVMDKLDPTGTNTKSYKAMFKPMSDSQFETFFKILFKDENSFLTLDVVDYERDLKIEHVEDAAKVLGIPLFEKIAIPYANMDKDNPIITKFEVPWGYIHVKRMQQMLSKKNTTSTDIGSRSAITGQVVGKDKNARDSDAENFALVTIDANDTLREFLGPRADDKVMKTEMYSEIARKGYTSLNGLTNDVENKTTLNTLDVFMMGMGLKTDLISDTLILRKTLE